MTSLRDVIAAGLISIAQHSHNPVSRKHDRRRR
jgi:hypothetical protein